MPGDDRFSAEIRFASLGWVAVGTAASRAEAARMGAQAFVTRTDESGRRPSQVRVVEHPPRRAPSRPR